MEIRWVFLREDEKMNVLGTQKILIVDDIYTTGSTVNAIAEKLKSRGVQRVYFLVLCIGKGF